jgi:hypothetical protein
MLTDADWNELMEIVKARIETALGDVVGSGMPREQGLKIDRTESGNYRIRPGTVYVDGIRGEVLAAEGGSAGNGMIDFVAQDDFPHAIGPQADADCVFYVDLWERPVMSLEDPELLDAGLHGADTCSRTQTMVQIKWCEGSIESLPALGNARLQLELQLSEEEEKSNWPLGNYLFRLEVHDVGGNDPTHPTSITLKWSRENGAEQHRLNEEDQGPWDAHLPRDYLHVDYVYEFYNDTSERHLGVHQAAGFQPFRGMLRNVAEKPLLIGPEATAKPPTYIRRWDGYCILQREGQNWSIRESSLDNAWVLEDGNLALITGPLALQLELQGRTFVVGDHWLALVREHARTSDKAKLLSPLPYGIRHHYLELAEVRDGSFLSPSTTKQRQLAFPTLTALTADRIGHRLVDSELENLASLGLFDLSNQQALDTTLAGILDKLLYEFDSRHIAIGEPVAPLFEVDDQMRQVKSVQDGLEWLVKKIKGQGCAVTVGPSGFYKTLDEAAQKLSKEEQQKISLCLLPGEHSLDIKESALIDCAGSFKLTGAGPLGSIVRLKGASCSLRSPGITLQDLTIQIESNDQSLSLAGDRIRVEGCAFKKVINNHLASRVLGNTEQYGTKDLHIGAMAVGDDGSVTLVGLFRGSINFGSTEATKLTSEKGDGFIARFSRELEYVASRVLAHTDVHGGTIIEMNDVCVDAAGQVVVIGKFEDVVNIGNNEVTELKSDQVDGFVARLDVDLQHIASRSLGNTNYYGSELTEVRGVALDAEGNALITGTFINVVNFGDTEVTKLNSSREDGFLVKLDPQLNHLGSRVLAHTETFHTTRISVDGITVDIDGNSLIVGLFEGAISFDGTDTSRLSNSGSDGFIAKFDHELNPVDTRLLGATDSYGGEIQQIGGVTTDAEGNVLLTGQFHGVVNFSENLQDSLTSAAGDGFIVRLDKRLRHTRSRRLGNTDADLCGGQFPRVGDVTVDAMGNAFVTGEFKGTVRFGEGDETRLTGRFQDGFVVGFDPYFRHLWSRSLGGRGQFISAGVDGQIVNAGTFSGSVNFGGETLTAELDEGFVVRFLGTESPLVIVEPLNEGTEIDLDWVSNEMHSQWSNTQENSIGKLVSKPWDALVLRNHQVGGHIRDNRIEGHLVLMGELPQPVDSKTILDSLSVRFRPGKALSLSGNVIHRLVSKILGGMSDLYAPTALMIEGNVFESLENSFVADAMTLTNNQFKGAVESIDVVGTVVARSGIFVGNQAGHPMALIRRSVEHKEESANLLTFWEPKISISPASWEFTASEGTGSVDVETDPANGWTVSTPSDWLEITSESAGSGNGTVYYRVLGNSNQAKRTGHLIIGDRIFSVTQAGIAITPSESNFDFRGGTGRVEVSAPSFYEWQAVSQSDWIRLTSAETGSGDGIVSYEVGENVQVETSTSNRTGTLIIADQQFTVTQGGIACQYSINPTRQSLSSESSTETVTVDAPAGCRWSARSNSAWIRITSATSGSGRAQLTYSVSANAALVARSGTLTIGGHILSVTQAACEVTLTKLFSSFDQNGGTSQIIVGAPAYCPWTAYVPPSYQSWITIISGSSGQGGGTIRINVASMSITSRRDGEIIVAGRSVSIAQIYSRPIEPD